MMVSLDTASLHNLPYPMPKSNYNFAISFYSLEKIEFFHLTFFFLALFKLLDSRPAFCSSCTRGQPWTIQIWPRLWSPSCNTYILGSNSRFFFKKVGPSRQLEICLLCSQYCVAILCHACFLNVSQFLLHYFL